MWFLSWSPRTRCGCLCPASQEAFGEVRLHLPCAGAGPQDGPDAAWVPWSSQPSRPTVEKSSHTVKFSTKGHAISSARALGRARGDFLGKAIPKVKSEAGVREQTRAGEGSLKHEATRVHREQQSFWRFIFKVRVPLASRLEGQEGRGRGEPCTSDGGTRCVPYGEGLSAE